MDYAAKFEAGLEYDSFLDKYATEEQRAKWTRFRDSISLTEAQQEQLAGFVREMKVIVLAGTWCGDCVNQCPIFQKFAEASDKIRIRYFDRDDHPDLAERLQTCGAPRVPAVLFLSEDNYVCGRAGDRTLAKYRQMANDLLGAACPSGITAPGDHLTADVVQEWFEEFERIQLMLRTSGRLRQLHGD
jgi:thiol-disulfide isomerase/thioredoxin